MFASRIHRTSCTRRNMRINTPKRYFNTNKMMPVNVADLGSDCTNEHKDLSTMSPTIAETVMGIPRDYFHRRVVVYKPAKHAMQQGWKEYRKNWYVRFERKERWKNGVMGWNSSGEPWGGTFLRFNSKEAAITFCNDNGFEAIVEPESQTEEKFKKHNDRGYSDNFTFKGMPDPNADRELF